jgi:hypothetical protein
MKIWKYSTATNPKFSAVAAAAFVGLGPGILEVVTQVPLRASAMTVGSRHMIDTCHGVAHKSHRRCTKIGCLRPMSLPKFVVNQWEVIGLESEECGERARGVRRVCVGVFGDAH